MKEINEGNRPIDKVDWLIRAGIGTTKELPYYRQALLNPHSTIQNTLYRPYVAEALDNLLDVIMNDSTVFYRIQNQLLHSKKSKKVYEALEKKARAHGISVDDINKEYEQGYLEGKNNKISLQEEAFNRVNNRLAKKTLGTIKKVISEGKKNGKF